VFVFQHVSCDAESQGLNPAIIWHIQQKRGLGLGIIEHPVLLLPGIIEYIESTVRAYVLGHVVEVLKPSVSQGPLIGQQLDTTPVDIGFKFILNPRDVPFGKILLFLYGD
jgi:hypothetical protein